MSYTMNDTEILKQHIENTPHGAILPVDMTENNNDTSQLVSHSTAELLIFTIKSHGYQCSIYSFTAYGAMCGSHCLCY